MATKIYEDYKAFSERENKEDNGVSKEFAAKNKDYIKDNVNNKGCWNCTGCTDCIDCIDCTRCTRCRHTGNK